MQCPSSYDQITRDLSQFSQIDMTKVAEDAMYRFANRGAHSLCHYVIKDNKVSMGAASLFTGKVQAAMQ